ncbi:VWA domain-containing protein, partial [Streptomyces sp. NPDC006132]|uniref:VWA domain-containing protein n=1 Tax=Streptomyces sp. NPDC006132 TaxID=3156732 RepID=UPI0033E8C807
EQPSADEPDVVAEPVTEQPSADEPDVVAEPVTEQPSADEPDVVAEPVAEKAKEDEPEIAEEPVADEPAVAEPAADAEAGHAAETHTIDEPESSSEPETSAAQTEAAPEGEAQPEPEAQPEAKAKAETDAPAETSNPAPKAEAEPTPAQPEPEQAPETEPQPEPAPEAEAEAAPTEKPKAAPEPSATPDPAAADGAQPPQGPPAPDNESSTGGAGGNNTAEGEAEAEAEPQPPKPALTLAQLKTHAPTLATAYRAATTTLKTHNLTGTRAKVYLVLDRSASMRPYYKDGSAQALAEQTLALAAHLDPEATVPVVFFSTELDGTGEITLTDHENKIDDLHAGLGRMGRTSYHAAVEAVLAHHDKEATPDTPALVIFQTDGAPDAKTPATQALTNAAKTHPTVFFSFVAFGDPENKAFDYLRKLKTPNTSHFLAGETPRELTDKQLYDGVLANWRP